MWPKVKFVTKKKKWGGMGVLINNFSSGGSRFSFPSAAEPFPGGWKALLQNSHPTSSLK